ncbi:hypothetical protein [Aurantiacibacter poecillastricola]|uniref:hypothetical protein n=1 Tax=Aurantiacibacter poecillastricola TaxID=3064385 RepID=UPI00273E16BF|nr:hypothetical protein [Aurantiacibacter sp. 219JJ12-13]MDP5261254.1 hypothetical protein [Aurantiacibacter sp. 219JJ12-13]
MSRGYVPSSRTIPGPDMSFVRLFDDLEAGWQFRGQYAIWTGSAKGERSRYTLLERHGDRVAPMAYEDGSPVFHEIKANVPFIVQGLMSYWVTFNSDAMWLDTPSPEGQYAFLAVGGSAGKPSAATIDWTCTHCGHPISPKGFEVSPLSFKRFLMQADEYAAEFDRSQEMRTCTDCGTIHPAMLAQSREIENRTGETDEA